MVHKPTPATRSTDPTAVRRFQSVDDLLNDPALATARDREIGLPPSAADDVARREFMKLLGATFAAAGLAAEGCARLPKTVALPYVDKPEGIYPGKAVDYASTCRGCAAGCGTLVKSRDGRPIKIEGNPQHPVSKGGVCAVGQAQVIDLYDGDRLRGPLVGGKPAQWAALDAALVQGLAEAKASGGLVLVTRPITGPATRAAVQAFRQAFPGAEHVELDEAGGSAIRAAHALTHGKAAIPSYRFENTDHVVSLGADFLGTWLDPVGHAKGWAQTRKVGAERKTMAVLALAEAHLSLTGSNADDRIRVLPSEMRALALGLLDRVAKAKGFPMPVAVPATAHGAWLDAQAKALLAHEGKGLVVAGSADVAVQGAVAAVNDLCKNYGQTLDLDTPLQVGVEAGTEAALVAALNGGQVARVVLWDVNPCHASAHAAGWRSGLAKATFSLALTTRNDETTQACKLAAAINHSLEAWGDVEVRAGLLGVQQPLVRPLFDTRQAEDVLLAAAGVSGGFYAFMQQSWAALVHPRAVEAGSGFQAFWDKAVHDGYAWLRRDRVKQTAGHFGAVAIRAGGPTEVAAPQAGALPTAQPGLAELVAPAPGADLAMDASAVGLAGDASAVGLAADASAVALAAEATPAMAPVLEPPPPWRFDPAGVAQALAVPALAVGGQGAYELVLYEKVGLRDGRHANNPFLQELPDPLTKATWGNYACIAPATAAKLGLASSDVVTVTAGAVKVELPVVLAPGTHDGVIAVAVGYGRKGVGRIADGHGADAWPFAALGGLLKCDVAATGRTEPVAFSQTHHSYEHRDVVKETTLAAWQHDPTAGNPALEGMLRDPNHPDKRYARTLWPRHEYPGHKWGLAVDLNSCTGCGACVIACNVENNIPVVGKHEVLVRREMHWMRIDRYFSERKRLQRGEYDWTATRDDLLALADNPEVVHMPMMCQHCDNAGCETVCPVLATVHTTEGLNAQVYNRCVGTRYCANNCAYKVRRFNWFNYPTTEMADKFDADLVTLALNPDVVRRSRGVMEKCSFCVQRIQESKADAVREHRTLQDGDVVTACQQTCPTNALVFGDLNEEGSGVRKAYQDPRGYAALVEVGTQPAVTYLTKVRPKDMLDNFEDGSGSKDGAALANPLHGHGHEPGHDHAAPAAAPHG